MRALPRHGPSVATPDSSPQSRESWESFFLSLSDPNGWPVLPTGLLCNDSRCSSHPKRCGRGAEEVPVRANSTPTDQEAGRGEGAPPCEPQSPHVYTAE